MSVTLDGDLTVPVPLGAPEFSYPISNFRGLQHITQEYAVLSTEVPPPPLGSKHHIYSNAICAEQSGAKASGIISKFTRTFVNFPRETITAKRWNVDSEGAVGQTLTPNQQRNKFYFSDELFYELDLDPIEYHFGSPVEVTYTYPAFDYYNSFIIGQETNDINSASSRVVHRGRAPYTLTVMGLETSLYINLMDSKYAEYISGADTQITSNTKIYYKGQIYSPLFINQQTGTVTIRVGTENVVLTNAQLEVLLNEPSGFDISSIPIKDKWIPRKVNYRVQPLGEGYESVENNRLEVAKAVGTRYTKPNIEQYLEAVEAGIQIRGKTTRVEQHLGCIYRIVETLIPLK